LNESSPSTQLVVNSQPSTGQARSTATIELANAYQDDNSRGELGNTREIRYEIDGVTGAAWPHTLDYSFVRRRDDGPIYGMPPPILPSFAGTWLGRFLGKPFPTKIGTGSRLQPYDPQTGRYLSPLNNPGFKHSVLGSYIAGVGQGYGAAKTGTPPPLAVNQAQFWGQATGSFFGGLFN